MQKNRSVVEISQKPQNLISRYTFLNYYPFLFAHLILSTKDTVSTYECTNDSSYSHDASSPNKNSVVVA
jgi:hypothetical protein